MVQIVMGAHRLTAGPHGWMIERRLDPSKAPRKAGAKAPSGPQEATWGSPTYPSTLQSALTAILEERIKASDAATLREMADVIAREHARLRDDITPLTRVSAALAGQAATALRLPDEAMV